MAATSDKPKKRVRGRPFPKGHKFSVGKRAKKRTPEMAQRIRDLELNGQLQIREAVDMLLMSPPAQYKLLLKTFEKKATTMLEVGFLKVLSSALQTGDERKFGFILERWAGKSRYEAIFNPAPAATIDATIVSFEDVIFEVMHTDTMTDMQKTRAVTDILYRKQQIELSRKMAYTPEEFIAAMEATMTAAQQVLANSPKALDKFTKLYTDQMKQTFGDRLLETNPTTQEGTDDTERA